jgi:membrane peptidoglycan carboxypeptidase
MQLTRRRLVGIAVLVLVIGYATHVALDVVLARAETRLRIGGDLARAALSPDALAPEHLRALLAVQDPRFFEHRGWDPLGGTSTTITQALVKRYYFDGYRRGIWSKLRQSLIARFALDPLVSKREQLTLFINTAYLGTVDGTEVNGFEEGAQVFFGKPFAELTNDEYLALLVFDAPNHLNPRRAEANARHVRQVKELLARAE